MFSFFGTAFGFDEFVTSLKQKIKMLHQLTKFSTFYEFFGVREGCDISEINKAYRRLSKAAAPAGVNPKEFRDLVTFAFGVLRNQREIYDRFLSESKFYYITEASNFKNSIYLMVIALICLLVFIDFVVYAVRYLKHVEQETLTKKENKKNKINPPSLLSKNVLNSASSFFSKSFKSIKSDPVLYKKTN